MLPQKEQVSFKNPFESVKVNPSDLKIHFCYSLEVKDRVLQVPIIFPIYNNILSDSYQVEFKMLFTSLISMPEQAREAFRFYLVRRMKETFEATGNKGFDELIKFIKRDTQVSSMDFLTTKSLLEMEESKEIDLAIADEILAHVIFFIVPAAVRRTRLIDGVPNISSLKSTELLDYYRTLIMEETSEEK